MSGVSGPVPEQVRVVLEGGPDGVPPSARQCWVPAGEPEVKVRYANRTEHFCSTGESVEIDRVPFQVYRWSYSTYVAE
jgi:hypothetical protein